MIRLLIIVIFLILLIVFALSNTEPMPVWMASFGWKVPLGTSALALATFSLFLGLVIGWIGEFGQRRRARRAEHQLRILEKSQSDNRQEIEKLKAQLFTREHSTEAGPVSVTSIETQSGSTGQVLHLPASDKSDITELGKPESGL